MMKSLVDVSVLLIFFNRPEKTRQVFEQIKKARPAKLFLYQDGARVGRPDDIGNCNQCRAIVENIDWECEVYKLYQEKNYGCDPSEFLAIRWMFNHVDRGIILEDDDVPTIGFFRFCKELLDKYADNEDISTISGMNHLNVWAPAKSDADYFFAHGSSIWGWATWKRFVDMWDVSYSFLDDPEKMQRMRDNFVSSRTMKSDRVNFDMFVKKCEEHRQTGKEFYETLVSSTRILHGQMGIFPTKNMISNIGFSGERTHGDFDLRMLPKATQKVYSIERHELTTPIKHPKTVCASDEYVMKKECLMTPTIFTFPLRWLESKIRGWVYGRK